MSEAKHTPGPWDFIVGKTLLHIETNIDNPVGAGIPICSIPKSNRANARLIAAAPDLLAALKEIIADHKERMILYPKMNNQENRIRVMELAKAAIAKTEGKP